MHRLFFTESTLTLIQVGLSAVLATVIGLLVGQGIPIFAPLMAITLIQVLCAPRRRSLWFFLFGWSNGALATTMFVPNYSTRNAFINGIVGVSVAIGVAYLTTPRNPVRRVNEAIEPVLGKLAINVRAIATALRSGDTAAAGSAVFALNDVDNELNRLQDVLRQVRRSAIWRRVSRRNLADYVNSAREIGFAVRDIRTLARHAWWGVLRTGEPVPPALPQMLDTLADGLAVLRDEMHRDGQPHEARPLLVSAGRWVDVMRAQPLSISAATVAASADAAVLDLLISTGVPLNDADQMLRRPSYSGG